MIVRAYPGPSACMRQLGATSHARVVPLLDPLPTLSIRFRRGVSCHRLAAFWAPCDPQVDLVVTWLREAGVEDMWAHEAAVLALGLASPAPTVTHGGGSADPSNPATGASTRSSVILLHQ